MSTKKGTPKVRRKAYDIIETRAVPQGSGSTVSQLRQRRRDDLLQQADEAELERFVAESNARTERAKRGILPNSPGGMGTGINIGKIMEELLTKPASSKAWLEYTPDQRAVMMKTIQQASMMQGMNPGGAGGGTSAFFLPMMMAQMNQKPQTSVMEMVQLIQAVNGNKNRGNETLESFKMMLPYIQNNQNQNQNPSNVLKEALSVITPLYTQMSGKDKNYYDSQLEWYRGQIQSPMAMITELKNTAAALGMQQAGSSAVDVQKMIIEQQRWQSTQDFERAKWQMEMGLQQANDKSRNKMMSKLAGDTLKSIGPIIEKFSQDIGKKPGTQPPTQQTQQTQIQVQQPTSFICDGCGAEVSIAGNPDSVTCPNKDCGKLFKKQG